MYCEDAFAAKPWKWFSKYSIILRMHTIWIKEWGGCIFKLGGLVTVRLLGIRRHHTDSLDQVAEILAPRLMLLVN